MEDLKLTDLVDGYGQTWASFRRALRTHWWRVAFDLALGYVALTATAWLLGAAVTISNPWSLLWLIPGAMSFGFWMAYLQLFLHEAAHFNIAASRRWNDLLANALIASWVGTSIADYRTIHWQHHRFHGETRDSEHSYFSALNSRFLMEGLTGLSALRVIAFRRRRLAGTSDIVRKPPSRLMLAVALLLHGGVLAIFMLSGHGPVALAWLAGIGVFFPFFGSLRQLLEHRSEQASGKVDYHQTPHGRTTRMFREGLFGSTFGAAGFTRHMLHHWDSSVSYTNLAEVEAFLQRCPASQSHLSAKTSYWRALRALYGN